MRSGNIAHLLAVTRKVVGSMRPALLLPIFVSLLLGQGAPSNLPRVYLSGSTGLIYSNNSSDAWNRIFYFLLSRRLQVRLSSDFPEGAPFTNELGDRSISTRTFERNEIGDRAIDPMYPTFFVGFGSMLVLSDSTYPQFIQALSDALNENVPRSVNARALMQSDLWGAYDALFPAFLPDDERKLGELRRAALDLIGQLIRKVALTPDEISTLPDNYSSMVRRYSLPDVFAKDSVWIEIAWFLPRMHDGAAGYRRVSRVFLKPTHAPRDIGKFLEAQASTPDDPSGLDGVALLTQLLLIDSRGDLQPTRVTSEVQVRLFLRTNPAKPKTTMRVCEISRKLFLQNPNSGGLVLEEESTPAYLSNGGSYGFAEGQFMPGASTMSEPVQVKLRTRCAACHGENLAQIMTFSIARPPKAPPIRQLNPAAADVADIDMANKRKSKEFQALREYFKPVRQ